MQQSFTTLVIKYYNNYNKYQNSLANPLTMIQSKELGKKIKQLRQSAELSQAELAKAIGTSREIVSNIENGVRMPKLDEINKLSELFECSIDALVNNKESVEIIVKKSREAKPKKETLRISVPQKNLIKFKEVLLYILNKVGAKPNVGETVIQKMLYFIDFDYYEKHEEQLVGANYIRSKFGPTPAEFIKIIGDMIENKDVVKVKNRHFSYSQTKYLPLRNPDLSALNANELNTIDNVLGRLSDMNASQIAEYSHNDIPWLGTEDQEKIDYEAVFYRTPAYSVRNYIEEDQG